MMIINNTFKDAHMLKDVILTKKFIVSLMIFISLISVIGCSQDNNISLSGDKKTFSAKKDGMVHIKGTGPANAKIVFHNDNDGSDHSKDETDKINSSGKFDLSIYNNYDPNDDTEGKIYSIKNHHKSKSIEVTLAADKSITDSDDDTNDSDEQSSNSKDPDSSDSTSTIAATSEYPDISTLFDTSNMSQYSEDNLHKGVTIKNFYVKDIGADKLKSYHLLLTPKENSDQYFLIVTDKLKEKVKLSDTISAKGTLNGSSKIDQTQINTGISENYLGKPITLLEVDKIEKDN